MLKASPLRGTQSFVGVMAEVFRRPSLTGLEVLWRWTFWGLVLLRPAPWLIANGARAILAFQTGGFQGFGRDLVDTGLQAKLLLRRNLGACIAALGFWLLVSAVGRLLVLRRAGRGLQPRFGPMLALSAARWISWALAVSLWVAGLLLALQRFVLQPQQAGREGAWVPFCGAIIFGTLLLFVGWLGSSWVFALASLYAAQGRSLRESLHAAARRNALAGKLAEVNLVLGIVKIALIVLAMVFSACPLPFESVETQQFLVTWTAGVLLLYFVASDYFHVVRTVAFLRMTEVLGVLPLVAAARNRESAS